MTHRAVPDDGRPMDGDHPTAVRGASGRELDRLIFAQAAALETGEAVARRWLQLRGAPESTGTEDSLDVLLGQALTDLAHAFDAEAVVVLLADDSGELVARAASGLEGEVWHEVHIGAGAGIAGRVLVDGQPMVVPDLSAAEPVSEALRSSGVRSLVAVPIAAHGRVLGVLHADSYQLGRFDDGDARILAVVANRLGESIDRARLLDAERAARARAEATADRLGRLQRITAALAGDLDAERIAEIILSELTPEFGADATSHMVWMVEGDRLRLLRAWDASYQAVAFADIPLHAPLPGPEALRTGASLWLESKEAIEEFEALRDAKVNAEAVAVLPLVAE
ncbi:MAG: GAF domain-containing protein, partial [Acidimicrobiales bacterium]